MQVHDIRDLYHQTRRLSTVVTNYSGHKFVNRATTISEVLQRAKGIKMPRGSAALRRPLAKAVAETRIGVSAPSLANRLNNYLASKYAKEIEARGGEVVIEEENRVVPLRVLDRTKDQNLLLLGADGWRKYGRMGKRHAAIAYLCGLDDNGSFAVRVPSTCKTVEQAVQAVEPAEVAHARANGRRVLRQGDVYIIEMLRDATRPADLPANHVWDAAERILRHQGGHEALAVPFPAKFVAQRVLRMGRLPSRGARTGRGD